MSPTITWLLQGLTPLIMASTHMSLLSLLGGDKPFLKIWLTCPKGTPAIFSLNKTCNPYPQFTFFLEKYLREESKEYPAAPHAALKNSKMQNKWAAYLSQGLCFEIWKQKNSTLWYLPFLSIQSYCISFSLIRKDMLTRTSIEGVWEAEKAHKSSRAMTLIWVV